MSDGVQRALSNDEVKSLKAKLTAVTNNSTGNKTKKKKNAKNTLFSKAYNAVATRPLRRMRNPVQTITANMRGELIGVLTSSTVATTYAGKSWAIVDFSGSSEFLGLFDQYRFDYIEAWLEPQQSQSTALSNQGILVSAIDLDDSAVPTSIVQVEDKQSSLTTGGLDGHYHAWSPHMAVATYSGAFTSFSNTPADWIDSGSPNVQHYGLKFSITSTSVAITYNLHYRARLSFRQPGI